RVRRPGRAVPGAHDHRPRLPLAAPLLDGAGGDAAAGRRRRRPGDRAAERSRRRRDHGFRRRPGADRDDPPAREAAAAMTVTHSPALGAVWRRGRWSLLVHRRSVAVGLTLFGLVVAVGLISLAVGDYPISVPDTVRTLLGNGSVDTDYVIFEERLPRLLTALAAGAAFGASGALFQSLTRNPLGSPDIIGFTAGASTGALAAFLLIGTTLQFVATGAIIGGLASAVVVYGLAYRRGTTSYRLVLIGVAVQLLLLSTNTFLLMRADVLDAQSASWWLVGSLNGRDYGYAAIAGTAVVLLLPAALLLHRR